MVQALSEFKNLEVGDGVVRNGVTLFPLRGPDLDGPDYVVGADVMKDGLVDVSEVSEGGSVQSLLLENKSPENVFLAEGETLIGAKQNRTLNVSILLAPHSRTAIPVSCVEQGRWRYKTRKFSSSKYHSHPKLRSKKSYFTGESLKRSGGYEGSQGEVWDEVQIAQACYAKQSPTGAVHDVYDSFEKEMEENVNEFSKALEGARGIVAAIGEDFYIVDLFDRRSTLDRYKDRLIRAAAFQGLEPKPPKSGEKASAEKTTDPEAARAHVAAFLERASEVPNPETRPSPGLGNDVRGEGEGVLSVGLEVDGTAVHSAAFTLEK